MAGAILYKVQDRRPLSCWRHATNTNTNTTTPASKTTTATSDNGDDHQHSGRIRPQQRQHQWQRQQQHRHNHCFPRTGTHKRWLPGAEVSVEDDQDLAGSAREGVPKVASLLQLRDVRPPNVCGFSVERVLRSVYRLYVARRHRCAIARLFAFGSSSLSVVLMFSHIGCEHSSRGDATATDNRGTENENTTTNGPRGQPKDHIPNSAIQDSSPRANGLAV